MTGDQALNALEDVVTSAGALVVSRREDGRLVMSWTLGAAPLTAYGWSIRDLLDNMQYVRARNVAEKLEGDGL